MFIPLQDILEHTNQLIETVQQSFLKVTAHPTPSVIGGHALRQSPCLIEINQPSAHPMLIVHDEHTAAHNLMPCHKLRLLDKTTHRAQSLDQLACHVRSAADKVADRLVDLNAALHGLQVSHRFGVAHFQRLHPKAVMLRR